MELGSINVTPRRWSGREGAKPGLLQRQKLRVPLELAFELLERSVTRICLVWVEYYRAKAGSLPFWLPESTNSHLGTANDATLTPDLSLGRGCVKGSHDLFGTFLRTF